MTQTCVRNLMVLLLIASSAAHAADPAPGACEVAATNPAAEEFKFKNFPIKDLLAEPDKTVNEGAILPTPIGMVNNKRVASTVPSNTAFFAANILTKFAELDSRKTQEFSQSLPISYMRQFGLVEMSMLGPDLSKPDPFLDMRPANADTPSIDKIEETNLSLAELSRKMTELLGDDQRTALQNLMKGNVSTSMKQVEANLRNVLSKISFLKGSLGGFLHDKKFLQDMQLLLTGNLEQFERDLIFIDEIQARYQKVRDALEKLSKEGEAIAGMKAAVLATIKDEATRKQVEAEFVRYEGRVTDLTAGIAICDTFINMWDVIKSTHHNLIAGITRTLYFTVPIIGASQQLNNALKRQENAQAAIHLADTSRDKLITQMNQRMKTSVDTQHRQQMQAIQTDADSLGALLVGTILVRQTIEAQNEEKVVAYRAARERYKKISEDARAQQQKMALPPAQP